MKRIEITPPKDLELAGYPHYPRYNEGAHDPLYAACMYLENDGIEAVMVTLLRLGRQADLTLRAWKQEKNSQRSMLKNL